MPHRPQKIVVNKEEKVMIIVWDDGHESRYPFRLLRERCPCAECREEPQDPPEGMLVLRLAPRDDLDSVELVGSYAIQFFWSDGHHHGIYSWDLLRRLCPCPTCSREQRRS